MNMLIKLIDDENLVGVAGGAQIAKKKKKAKAQKECGGHGVPAPVAE